MVSTVVTTTYRNILGRIPPLPIVTERLLIRVFPSSRADFETFHAFFTPIQTLGDSTRTLISLMDPRRGLLYLGVFLQNPDRSEGDMVGIGGLVQTVAQGTWPTFNWQFMHPKYSCNYKGLGTEFATAFMQFWWSIPEEAVKLQLRVPANSVDFPLQDQPVVAPRVVATAHVDDFTKQCALGRAGFEMYDVDMDDDGVTYWRHVIPTPEQPECPPSPRPSGFIETTLASPSKIVKRKSLSITRDSHDDIESGGGAKRAKALLQLRQSEGNGAEREEIVCGDWEMPLEHAEWTDTYESDFDEPM